MCGYIAATGVLWSWSSVATGATALPRCRLRHAGHGDRLLRSLDGGGRRPAAGDRQCAGRGFHDPALFAAIRWFPSPSTRWPWSMVVYSIAVTRRRSPAGAAGWRSNGRPRRRSTSSTSSRTAAAAGSGKPTRSAPCPTSREQLAEDFQCEPEALLGRQFTDLLSVDTSVRTRSRSARRSASTSRPASPSPTWSSARRATQDVQWSLSGNPSFDEHGRFLGFRGIGTDLTEQRRSEQEINRLARFDSLTGLPNRAMMRQTLDEALRNADPPAEGLRPVPDRSRPLQERQRHARPSGRRRAAAPGRRAPESGDGRPRPGRPARRRRVPGGASRHASTSACSNRSRER